MRETVPMFLMYGLSVVDVGFVEAESVTPGGEVWRVTGRVDFENLSGPVDAVVLESPVGCVMWSLRHLPLGKGDNLYLHLDREGREWTPCERPRMVEEEEEVSGRG